MAYKFYKSDEDGYQSTQILSGMLNSIFTTIDFQMRLSGDHSFKKVWLESDADVNSTISVLKPTAYNHYLFVSASDDDVEADLTDTEDRYGSLDTISRPANDTVKVTNDPNYSLVRSGNFMLFDSTPYIVDTVTDNGDGTTDIKFTSDVPAAIPSYITSLCSFNLVADTARSFWRERKIDANSAWGGADNSVNIVVVD